MAHCRRCNKFMLLKSTSGYCKDCDILIAEEEHKRKVEEEKRRKEEERQRKAEEEKRRKEEEERKRKAEEEERQRKAEEEKRRKEEEERQRKAEEEKRRKAEEERKRKSEEEEAKRKRIADEEKRIKGGDPMKYTKAVQKNVDFIDSHMMRDKASSTLLFGSRPVTFYPVRAVRLMTETDEEYRSGFHVIGVLHFGMGSDMILCAEIRTNIGIDLFWVTGKGRVPFKDDEAASFNYALNELVSFDDGNFDAMVKYILATWTMDPTSW